MAQKDNLQLVRGSRIRAKVIELQAGGDLLVAFQGNLVRVQNHTGRGFKKDDILNLQVVGVNPVEFKIYERATSFDRVI